MSNAATILPRLAVIGLLVALVGHLGLLLVGGIGGVRAPTAIEYGEPFIVSAAHLAANGGTLYAPVDDLPFLHNNYNPAVQLAMGPWLKDRVSYGPMRLVTLLSVLGMLGAAGVMVWRETRSVAAATAAALLPLTCGFMFPWMCVGRVDGFATLCSCLAFCWAAAHRHGTPSQRAWLLLPAWLAFFAKQSVVGGAGAAMLMLFLDGRRREALTTGLVFTAGCGAMVWVTNLLTDGQYWLHAVAYNASHDRGGFWPQTLPPLKLLEALGWPLLILLCVSLPRARREDRPLLCWLLTTWVLGFVLVRKSGAHVHYLLEAVVASSVCVAVLGRRQLLRVCVTARGRTAAALTLVLVTVATIPGRPWAAPGEWRSGAYFKSAQARSLLRLGAAEDPIPEEVRLRIEGAATAPLLLAQTATIAIECGRPAIFDIADFARLEDLGEWDPDRLLEYVRARRFPVVAVQPVADPDARRLFGVDAVEGLKDAVQRHYRALPVTYRDRTGRVTATFWVPRT